MAPTPAPQLDAPSEETRAPGQRIMDEVTSWPGVEAGPGRRGEFAFWLGCREIGHLHGDHAAYFSFPKALWRELIAEGWIGPHPVFPNAKGPAARRIESEADIRDVIALMRLNYNRLAKAESPTTAARVQR